MRLVEAVTMKPQPISSTNGIVLSDVGNTRVDVHPMGSAYIEAAVALSFLNTPY